MNRSEADPDRLADWLIDWEMRTRGGEAVDLDALTAEAPHLLPELLRRIEVLRDLDALMEAPPGATPATSEAGPMAGRLDPGRLPEVPGYDLVAELGRGGMGVVYRAWQQLPRREVALKLLNVAEHAPPEDFVRFLAEAETMAALRHPNVVSLHEVGSWEHTVYLSMDYVGDGSLADRLARDGPMAAAAAAALGVTLARAVQFIHDRGILHRDLKPSNVLLERDGTPRLADFGLAVRRDVKVSLRGDRFLGTPSYVPPEQAMGRSDRLGPTADVYSLGAILFEALTGRPPFRGETPLDTVWHVIQTPAPSPRSLVPSVPRDLAAICNKCLSKRPHERYSGADLLADDLERVLRGEPVRARPAWWPTRVARRLARTPVASGLGVACAGLVAAVGLLLVPTGVTPIPRDVEPLPAATLARTADQIWVVLRTDRGEIEVWNGAERRRSGRMRPPPGSRFEAAAIGPDGRWVACLIRQGGRSSLWRWTVRRGELRLLAAQNRPATALAIDPAGRRVAWGDEVGGLRVADAEDGSLLAERQGNGTPVLAVRFPEPGWIEAATGGGMEWWMIPTAEPTRSRP